MRAAKVDKGQVGRRRRRAIKALAESEGMCLALPAAEIRQLVLQNVFAGGVAPFVRRMVSLIDGVKAGRAGELARAARRGRNRPLARFVCAVARAAEQGRFAEAEQTALYAAGYAYCNTLDYFLSLRAYLDGFRRTRARRTRS